MSSLPNQFNTNEVVAVSCAVDRVNGFVKKTEVGYGENANKKPNVSFLYEHFCNNEKVEILDADREMAAEIIDYLKNNDIKWFYAPGCNALSVVNYVMSSICFLREEGMFDLTSSVGIIGYGNIGKNLKKALDYFSIENFIYDPFLNFDFLVDIDQIKNCNLITLHVPLTYKTKFPTRNIIDEVFLSDMQGKTIINTSRGGVVDESKLINLQNTNYISDVWIGEPCPSNEIINFALLATPHIAGHSIDGKINGTIMLIESLQNCIDINTDQKKLNLHVMKNFISSNDIGDEDEFFIDNYNKEYDIKLESDIFKTKYVNSNIANKKNIFNEVRSNHLARKDFKI
mgnify:CR=1 FL=1